MSTPILTTKLFIPPLRPGIVVRPRLIERLNDGMNAGCILTLISAPAGFGKSTLVSEWLASTQISSAWLSLDERDRDPARFITYLIAALQKIKPGFGENLQAILQSPQPLQFENILTLLINEITGIEEDFLVVLDDYHSVDSPRVDEALGFLIEHQPSLMRLVIITREDPDLPLARLRARGNCLELRAADLRFTESETAEFLNRFMKLNLSEKDIDALEARTEGWIAGLQMAAISMQGQQDIESFIRSFTGSHRFVMDYLLEEVLRRQPKNIQSFLEKTSILDRMCGSICDAILEGPSGSSQSTLEYLERVNLFIIPQDSERKWYRYHHLFASLLRKRLGQSLLPAAIARLDNLASEWYENNDLLPEAFRHATFANDIEHAVRLILSQRMPLHLRGTTTMILDWLVTLPDAILNAQPILWWKQAQMLVLNGQLTEVEEKLKAAEVSLAVITSSDTWPESATRNMIGKIAAIRSNQAVAQQDAETILGQAHRALEYLAPDNLTDRSSVIRDMGFAHLLRGDRVAARYNFAESLSTAKDSGDVVEPLLSTIGLAQVCEMQNELYLADEYYRQILPNINEYSILNAGVVYTSMARIHYQWNELDTAERYIEKSLLLAQQFSQIPGRLVTSKLLYAQSQLARGDLASASAIVSETEQVARQNNFLHRISSVISIRILILLRQGNLAEAEQLTRQYDIPISHARVLLARGNPSAALTLLETYRQQMETKGWQDERLRTIIVQAVGSHLLGDKHKALQYLDEALASAEKNGFIRLFLDEGAPMAELLAFALSQGVHPEYVARLLPLFDPESHDDHQQASIQGSRLSLLGTQLVESLSPRELEVLRLLAKGLSNHQISQRLYLALDTVKGHNRRIFDKLNVKSRSEAIARAHELELL